MKSEPFISILLPVYNAAPSLPSCLQSLLSQSYQHIEIIAIDDFSKDKSYSLLKTFKKKDRRIHVYRNKKRYGLAICLNRALRRAKGSLIAFMDANDIATRDRMKRQALYLLSHPQVAAVGTQVVNVDESDRKLAKTNFPENHQTIIQSLLSGLSFQFETAMINKKLLPKDILSFKQNAYPLLFSDLFMKLLAYGEIANLPWVLQQHRQLSGKASHSLPLSSLIKLWLTSLASYDYRPPIRSLFPTTRITTNT